MPNVVKSVEFFELSTATTTVSCNLTKGQNYTNCVPFVSVRGGGARYVDTILWDCYFTGTTTSGQINFGRTNARSTTGYVNCYVVEFEPDEVYVEHGSFNISSITTSTITTVSGFNPERTGMVHYWKSDNSTSVTYNQILCRGSVTASGTLNFYRAVVGGSMLGHWFLFEAKSNQFFVTHGQVDSLATTSHSATGKSFDLLKTFLITSVAGGYSAPLYSSRSTLWVSLSNRDSVSLTKYASGDTSYFSYQVIEFQDNNIHVVYKDNPILSSTSTDYDLRGEKRNLVPIDLNYSMVINTPVYFDGCNAGNAYGAIEGIASTVKLTSVSGIRIEKDLQTTNTIPSIYVVDWKGYTVSGIINNTPIDPEISFVKSVQNNRIEVKALTNFIPLTKGQDVDNCVIFSSQSSVSDNHINNYLHDVYISDTNTVVAHRYGPVGANSSDAIVEVSVVEFYPDQIKVQSGTFGGNNVSLNPEASTVIPQTIVSDNSFLLFKHSSLAYLNPWINYNIRCRIIDNNTIGVTSGVTSNYSHITWFIVEDITENNTCFKVQHWASSGALASFSQITGNVYFPYYNTFLLCSSAGGYSADFYIDRSCCRSTYYSPNQPQIVQYGAQNETKYISTQTVRIVRNGTVHVAHFNPSFDTLTANFTGVLPTTWSGVSDITVYNNTASSFAYMNYGSYIVNCSAFCSISINDYNTQSITISHGQGGYTTQPSFNIICWQGENYNQQENLIPTKSLISSISKHTFTGADKYYSWVVEKCSYPEQCVPFATWKMNSTSSFTSCFRYFYIDKDTFKPYKLSMTTASVGVGGETSQVYLLEFSKDLVKVQSGTYGILSDNFTITIEEVNLTKAFLMFYSFTEGVTTFINQNISGVFENSTTLRFRRTSNTGTVFISWYVIECLQDQWRVQHLTLNSSSTIDTYLESEYVTDPQRRWVFSSYAGGYSAAWYSDRSVCRFMSRTDNLMHLNKYSTESISYINCEVVEFNKNIDIRVLWDDPSFSTTTTTLSNFNTTPLLSEERTIIIPSVFNNGNSNNASSTTTGPQDSFLLQEMIDFNINSPKVRLTKSGASYTSYAGICVTEVPDFNKYYIEGYTKEQRSNVSREVRAYRSLTSELVDSVTSSSGTGYFFVETPYSDAHYIICLDDSASPDYNDLIYGRIYPTVISGTFAYNEGLVTTSGFSIGVPLGRL